MHAIICCCEDIHLENKHIIKHLKTGMLTLGWYSKLFGTKDHLLRVPSNGNPDLTKLDLG